MKTWREFLCGVLLTLVLVLCVGHSGGVNSLFRFKEWTHNAAVGRVWTCTNATDGSGCYSNIPSSTAPTNFWRPLYQQVALSAATGAEVVMYSNHVVANTIAPNSSVWRTEYAFDKTGTAAATARVKLYLGGTNMDFGAQGAQGTTLIFDTEAPLVAASPDFGILVEIQRTADATETYTVKMICDPVGAYTNLYAVDASLGYSFTDPNNPLVLYATGAASGGDRIDGRRCVGDLRPAFQ